MDDYITIKQDKPPKKMSRRQLLLLLAVFFIVILIITIIAAAVIANSHRSTPDIVEVTNYDDLQVNPPKNTKENLDAQLYYLLSQHFNVPTTSKSVKATLRPETYQEESTDNSVNISFILDIDEFKQSYIVDMGWSNDMILPNDIIIECAPSDLSKYPNEPCYGMYHDSASPYLYLPYSGTLLSGETFTAKYNYEYGNKKYISITIQSCGNQPSKDEALQSTKDYLKSKGLDAEQYIYDINEEYNNCLINRN